MAKAKVTERGLKRYVQVNNDRAYRLAVKKLAGDEGLSITEYIERLVRAAHPEIDDLVRKFERAK